MSPFVSNDRKRFVLSWVGFAIATDDSGPSKYAFQNPTTDLPLSSSHKRSNTSLGVADLVEAAIGAVLGVCGVTVCASDTTDAGEPSMFEHIESET